MFRKFERMIMNTLINKAESISPRVDMAQRVTGAIKSGPKKRSSLLRRPVPIYGKVAIVAVLGISLAFHVTLMAVANNAADNLSKILKIGNYITVIQHAEDTAPDNEVIKQTPGGEVAISGKKAQEEDDKAGEIHYSTLAEAQKATCFKVLTPDYLPSGYAFKEAVGYKGSDQYLNLYFKGSGKDIFLMQRIMNEDTKFVAGTNGQVESVDIDGVKGVWEEPHTLTWEKDGVGCFLFCKGFSKEEAMKIAKSIK